MAKTQEIRTKITSISKTKKITNAMQMVAAGKRRKVELRMQASMPYVDKIKAVIEHIMSSSSEYLNHPYFKARSKIQRIGLVVVSTDRGLCGGLNINLFKKIILTIQEWQEQGVEVELFLIGTKAAVFFKNLKVHIRAQVKSLGDMPQLADLIGTTKELRNAFDKTELDSLFIAYNEFINTMLQKPKVEQLLPFPNIDLTRKQRRWDYIYEPNSMLVLQTLLARYLETQLYQAVVDNIACEQAARMVAMQNATKNAGEFIDALQLEYNKVRQAGITQEIAEIVGGAAAI